MPAQDSSPEIRCSYQLDSKGCHSVQICEHPFVYVRLSGQLITVVVCRTNPFNKAAAKSSVRFPVDAISFDAFEFWLTKRWPAGQNPAMPPDPPLGGVTPSSVTHVPATPGKRFPRNTARRAVWPL